MMSLTVGHTKELHFMPTKTRKSTHRRVTQKQALIDVLGSTTTPMTIDQLRKAVAAKTGKDCSASSVPVYLCHLRDEGYQIETEHHGPVPATYVLRGRKGRKRTK